MEIVAHRGFSARAPENTLAAFRLAAEHGADGIEFDVQPCADGTPVVLHDASVFRTTGLRGKVRGLALERLRELDAGSWFDAEFAEERIPTLDETLAHAAAAGLRVYPEVKGPHALDDVRRILDSLRGHRLLESAVLLAFDWRHLAMAREIEPRVRVGVEVDSHLRFGYAVRAAERFGNAVLSASAALLEAPGRMQRARATGVPVAAWTVDDAAQARRLAELGVATLMTNDPVAIREALRG